MIDGGLNNILRKYLPEVHWQRIESGGVGLGIPDLNGCCEGVEFWCELKATSGWTPAIRREQVAWLEHRARAGGRVFLLTRRKAAAGKRRAAADQLWVHRGADVRQVSEGGLQGPPALYVGDGGPAQWLWPVVSEILYGDPIA